MAFSAIGDLFGYVFPPRASSNNSSTLTLKPLPTKDDYRPRKIQYPEHNEDTKFAKPKSFPKPSQMLRFDANDPSLDIRELIAVIERDGGVIVENLISKDLASRIKQDLEPHFNSDKPDTSGFFPETTQRAIGLFGISDACVEYGTNPIFIGIANAMVSSTYEYWQGRTRHILRERPIISSTVAFRVKPGGTQQGLHRDTQYALKPPSEPIITEFYRDYHTTNTEQPVMIGCVTAVTKTTKENGATIVIPGSHRWDNERIPYDEEAVPAELAPGDGLIFLGNVYHAGGANHTTDQARETIGMFLCKPYLRQVENQYLQIPLERVKQLSPQAQRLLGYGICRPAAGFYQYQDPMRVLFGVDDEDVVEM